jgi:hypothetical protein
MLVDRIARIFWLHAAVSQFFWLEVQVCKAPSLQTRAATIDIRTHRLRATSGIAAHPRTSWSILRPTPILLTAY